MANTAMVFSSKSILIRGVFIVYVSNLSRTACIIPLNLRVLANWKISHKLCEHLCTKWRYFMTEAPLFY